MKLKCYEMLKSIRKKPNRSYWRYCDSYNADFEQKLHTISVFLLLTMNKFISAKFC